MKRLSKKEQKKLDKEAQVHKCLVCDAEAVRFNGIRWECNECGYLYGILENQDYE